MNLKRYTYKQWIRMAIGAWAFCLIGLSAGSCTRADVRYPDPDVLVRIYPDQEVYTLPALQYHFYNVDSLQPLIVRSGDSQGNFEGPLPVGSYRVIAVNTDAASGGNVTFDDMDNYELARANSVVSSQPNAQLSPLDCYLYSVVVPELIVASSDTIYRPDPVLLTKTVVLRFILEDELSAEVVSLDGILRGVYPSALLYTQTAVTDNPSAIDASAVAFNSGPTSDGWEAELPLFGLCDPGYGQVYENILTVSLGMREGGDEEIALRLTKILSNWFVLHKDKLPDRIVLNIVLTRGSILSQGGVTVWADSGESETIINGN
jgi:hypothetical protein